MGFAMKKTNCNRMKICIVLLIISSLNFFTAFAESGETLIDFSRNYSDVMSVEVNNSESLQETDSEINQKVLKWNNNLQSGQDGALKMTLNTPVRLPDSENDDLLVIEYSAKLSNRGTAPLMQLCFADKNGNSITEKNYETAFLRKNVNNSGIHMAVGSEWKWELIKKSNGSSLPSSELTKRYFEYKYVISGDGTYRFFIKDNNLFSTWCEPFKESVLYIKNPTAGLNTPEYFTGFKNRVLYENIDGKTSECFRYIKIYYDKLKYQCIDFRDTTNGVPNIVSGNLSGTSTTSAGVENDKNLNFSVLKWKNSNFNEHGGSNLLSVELPNSIDKSEGIITIEFCAKLGDRNNLRFLVPQGTDSDGNNVISDMGINTWYNADTALNIIGCDEFENGVYDNDNDVKINDEKIYKSEYNIYKYVINPFNNTYRFFAKKDNGSKEWSEPFGDSTLRVDNIPDKITSLYSVTRDWSGSASDRPSDSELAHESAECIKYITVSQGVEIISTDISGDGTLKNNCAKISFSGEISNELLNEKTFSVYKDTEKLALGSDYSLSLCDDNCSVKYNFNGITDYRDVVIKVKSGNLVSNGYSKILKDAEIPIWNTGVFVKLDAVNTGNGTIDEPYSSIYDGLNKVIKYKNLYSKQIKLYLMHGNYYMKNTLYIDRKYSGIEICGYGGEVNLYGADVITDDRISKANESDLSGRLPKNKIDRIYKINLEGLAIDRNSSIGFNANAFSDYLFDGYYYPELLNNKEPQTIVQWPDSGYEYTGEASDSDGNMTFKTNWVNDGGNLADMWVEGYYTWDYMYLTSDSAAYNKTDKTIDLTYSEAWAHSRAGGRYLIKNVPEELSADGEYYIDYDNNNLYYYTENPSNMKLMISGLKDGLLRFQEDTNNVKISGINFCGTRGTAVSIVQCNDIDIDNCIVSATGAAGIDINNSENCDITDCTFEDIGTVAVHSKGGFRPRLESSFNKITNCNFINGARIRKTYSPFVCLEGVGTEVNNNYFYKHKHSAIIFDGNNHKISDNIFDTCVQETEDSGCIYGGRTATAWGNVIEHNIFKNIKNDLYRANVSAIYIDDLMPGTTIKNNLFYDCSKDINIGGGNATKIIGNVTYDCLAKGGYDTRTSTLEKAIKPNGMLWSDINQMIESEGYDSVIWETQYPEYKAYVNEILNSDEVDENGDRKAMTLKGVAYKNNVYINNDIENTGVLNKWNLKEMYAMADSILNSSETVCNENRAYNDLSILSIIGNNIISYLNGIEVDFSSCGPIGYSDTEKYIPAKDRVQIIPANDYWYENFKEVSDISGLSRILINTLNGTVNLENGKLNINSGSSAEISLDKPIKRSFSITLSGVGSAKIKMFDINIDHVFNRRILEIKIDCENGKYYTYQRNDDNNLQQIGQGEFSTDILNRFEISSVSGCSIDYIAVSQGVCRIGNRLDFENGFSGEAVESYDKNIETYGSTKNTKYLIETSEIHGNEVGVYQWNADRRERGYMRYSIEPLDTQNKEVVVEYYLRSELGNQINYGEMGYVSGYSYGNHTKSYYIPITAVRQDTAGNLTSDGQIIATKAEFENGISLRFVIDGTKNKVILYVDKGSGYRYACEDAESEIPDVIRSIEFQTVRYGGGALTNKYYIDDIAIYDRTPLPLLYSDDKVIEDISQYKGNSVKIKPIYIPEDSTGVYVIGIYNGDESMLLSANLCKNIPNVEMPVYIPSDAGKIKIFSLDNINNIVPTREAVEYK